MISVLVERNKCGVLLGLKASGHAKYAEKGFDIVCSAVSILLKTTLMIVEDLEGIELEADTATRGQLGFKVCNSVLAPEMENELKFAGKFLEKGLGSISEEYPENLSVMYTTV
ncbi:MAG: ribosomal-processing cysteine protease Prp [Treponema sp.]|nr:ribosomal-processing cysteine protease Prp [Treponema sp.]